MGGRVPKALLVAIAVLAALGGVLLFSKLTGRPSEPFYGIDVPGGDTSLVAPLSAATGYRPSVFNIFVKLDTKASSFSVAKLDAIEEAGMTPMITLEPWSTSSRWGQSDLHQYSLRTIFDGLHDQSLTRLARVVADFHHKIYLRFAHEMNGSWYPWAEDVNGNHPGDYVRAWRHVHRLFTGAGATNALWVWAPNALLGSQGVDTYRELYPGDGYVDMVGLTAYGRGRSAAESIGQSLTALSAVSDKPVILAETGATGSGKTAWIKSFGRFLARHHQIVGFVWYNTTPESTGASGDYRFDQTPADLKAFEGALRTAHVSTDPSHEPGGRTTTSR